MKKYVKPNMELDLVSLEDIVLASGGYGDLGLVDGDINVNGNIWG